jgi:predicted transcriptional regulator
MSTDTKPRPELVERMAELARATDSTPEELTAAAGEYQRRVAELRALIDPALASLDRGEGTDGETFMRELLNETKARAARGE